MIDLNVHVVGARGVAPRHARNGAQPLRRDTVGGVIGAQEHEAVGLLLDDDLWISKHLKGEPKQRGSLCKEGAAETCALGLCCTSRVDMVVDRTPVWVLRRMSCEMAIIMLGSFAFSSVEVIRLPTSPTSCVTTRSFPASSCVQSSEWGHQLAAQTP